jgi:phage repressor protein C with HTH and peptisase S24 domain
MKSLAQNIVPLLKMAIDRCGNATELAKITGISNANISRWLKGDRDPRIGEFSPVLEYLGITMQLPGEEYYDFSYIPKVAAVAGAGASLETSDAIVGYYAFRTDFLGREHISERQSVLMDVRGDSMEPTLKDGDTVLIDQSEKEILDGRIYVVTLGDELRVKRVQKGWDGIVLTSDNPRYSDIHIAARDLEAFKVHGRVRWVGKML